MTGRFTAWLRLGRPHFLVGGFAFYALGALQSAAIGHSLNLTAYILGQLFVTMTQLGVHFGNEWHDLAADRANSSPTLLAGGSGVLATGILDPIIALRSSRISFAVAILDLLLIAWMTNPLVALIGAAILLFSWGYSAAPLRLHSRGVGGLVVGVVVAGLVPSVAFAQSGASVPASLKSFVWLAVPAIFHLAALVGVLSLPDLAGDAAVGKRTLAVRLGPRRAGRIFQTSWILGGLSTLVSILYTRATFTALAAGAALWLAVAFPLMAGTRRWNALSIAAVALVGLQWFVTVLALL